MERGKGGMALTWWWKAGQSGHLRRGRYHQTAELGLNPTVPDHHWSWQARLILHATTGIIKRRVLVRQQGPFHPPTSLSLHPSISIPDACTSAASMLDGVATKLAGVATQLGWTSARSRISVPSSPSPSQGPPQSWHII
jgi:hypothetical protein